MVALAIVAVVCFIAGLWAATAWLPALAPGPVGTLAYFVVCGLAGAIPALAAIHIWELVNGLETTSIGASTIVAARLVDVLWECGSLAALASITYLLAPEAEPDVSD